MRKLLSGLFLMIALIMILSPVVLLISGIDNTPLCPKKSAWSYDDILEAKAIIKRIKPNFLQENEIKTITLLEPELNLLLNYGVSHTRGRIPVSSALSLSTGHIQSVISFRIPSTPWGKFFNLVIDFVPDNRFLKVHWAQFGAIRVPGVFINPVLNMLHHIFMRHDLYADSFNTLSSFEDIRMDTHRVTLTYHWNPSALHQIHEKGKTLLLSPEKQQRLLSYHNELSTILSAQARQKIPLTDIIKPLFAFAARQSESFADPIMANTALIQMLALYITGTGIDNFIQKDLVKNARPLEKATLLLDSRNDLTKHFLVSAALSVSADSHLAEVIGIAKEVADSDGGSGFSFADLAADRAGIKFGESATKSALNATQFQQKIMAIKAEHAFMPRTDELPEGITRLEFKKRFSDLDSASYTLITREIESRISQCELYR